jgi:hypothetical protein
MEQRYEWRIKKKRKEGRKEQEGPIPISIAAIYERNKQHETSK